MFTNKLVKTAACGARGLGRLEDIRGLLSIDYSSRKSVDVSSSSFGFVELGRVELGVVVLGHVEFARLA